MPAGLILAVALFAGALVLAAFLGSRKRKAARRHELELVDLQKQLDELVAMREPQLDPVLKLAAKTMPLAELAEAHGRSEFYWHHRAALRLSVTWARAILVDADCGQPEFNNQVLFAITFINKKKLDAALEVFSELWLLDGAPRALKMTCLAARVEMYKIGGFYDEAARTEREMQKLASLGDGDAVSFEIN